MISVSSATGSKELRGPILSLGVSCESIPMEFGDAAFEGSGPSGTTLIGIERKTLHDILDCIDTARYNQQRIGMARMYPHISILVIEGLWKPREDGVLMEGFRDYEAEKVLRAAGKGREVIAWTDLKQGGGKVMYHKLYRYLNSVSHGGVIVKFTRDLNHTAFNICEDFHYYQKPWNQHKALLDIHVPQLPSLKLRPSLTRLWAFHCPGVGVVGSQLAEKYFPTGRRLANADEVEWVRAGVGAKTAQEIVKEINGWS